MENELNLPWRTEKSPGYATLFDIVDSKGGIVAERLSFQVAVFIVTCCKPRPIVIHNTAEEVHDAR